MMRPVGILVMLVLVVLQTVKLSVGAPIDTTIETTTGPITTAKGTTVATAIEETTTDPPFETTVRPVCGDTSWCDTSCYLDYSDIDTVTGCPNCICEERLRPACEYNPCGPEEDCVQNDSFWDFTCIPRYETSTAPPTCPPVACDVSDPNCFLQYGPDGCPEQCICGDPICMFVFCGTDEECVPSKTNHWEYTCVSIYAEETSTAPPTCPPIPCDDPNCFLENGPDGCPRQCICADPICFIVSCGPDEQCVPSEYNSYDYTCVSTSETSPWTTTTPAPTTTCPPYPLYHRAPGCIAYEDSDGCITAGCFTCDDIPPCGEGTTCELQICGTYPCPPPAICVPTTVADSCPPLEPCGIRCRYGLKTDDNGCKLCECLTERYR